MRNNRNEGNFPLPLIVEDKFTDSKLMECESALQIQKEIRSQIDNKKISNKKMKDFLAKYNDGNPYTECPVGCKTDCIEECYILIHMNLVNDDYMPVSFEELYLRDGEKHCCGKKLNVLDVPNYSYRQLERKRNLLCSVCGKEYRS